MRHAMIEKHHASTAESDGRLWRACRDETLLAQPLEIRIQVRRFEAQVVEAAT